MRPIDADELIAKINERLFDEGNPFPAEITEALDMIENAPTIEFDMERAYKNIRLLEKCNERPKGKWIADDEWGNCHCSVCNFENNHQPDFCENCGANMVADLCSICKHGDNCERSDKGISFANHSVCWKFER